MFLKCSLVVGEQSHKITGSITVTGVTAQMNPLQMSPHGSLVLVPMIPPGFRGTRASEQHFGQMNPLKFYSRILVSYDKYYDNFTKIYFPARWFVRAVIQNRDTCVPTEVESGFGILK